jgi:septal ring factor EnvC (AmiA/AmiB activator)
MDMNDKIYEAIKQNLPESTAGALKERLDQLEQTEGAHEKLKKDHEELYEEVKSLRKLKLTKGELDTFRRDLEMTDAELKDRQKELEFETKLNEVKLEAAKERVGDYASMFNAVFRNIETRNKVFGTADNGESVDRTHVETKS